MKFIFELILATIIVFFIWNILKRIFLNKFYKNFPQNPLNKETPKKENKINQKVNWDAETVEYEEIKENKETKN